MQQLLLMDSIVRVGMDTLGDREGCPHRADRIIRVGGLDLRLCQECGEAFQIRGLPLFPDEQTWCEGGLVLACLCADRELGPSGEARREIKRRRGEQLFQEDWEESPHEW